MMPRTKLGRNETAERIVRLLWGTRDAARLSVPEMAEAGGMSEGTLRRRKQRPEEFTIGELTRLGRKLHIPIEDLRAVIRY